MSTGRQSLQNALGVGPAASATVLRELLDGGVVQNEVSASQVPDWVGRLYSTELSERERACLRDAALVLIERHHDAVWVREAHDALVDVVELAKSTQLLVAGVPTASDRVWAAAMNLLRVGRSSESGALIILLGEHGPTRSVDTWSRALAVFGSPALPGCAAGVGRYGVARTLTWIDDSGIEEGDREWLLTVELPRMVSVDLPAIRKVMSDADRSALATQIREIGARLELAAIAADEVPDPRPAYAVHAGRERHLASMMGLAAGAFDELVNAQGIAPLEALRRYNEVDELSFDLAVAVASGGSYHAGD